MGPDSSQKDFAGLLSRALIPTALFGAIVIGALSAFFSYQLLALAAACLGIAMLVKSRHKAETFIGLYWAGLCIYDTLASSLEIQGVFYPFYAALFLGLVVTLIGPGARFRASALVLFSLFLLTVAQSFIGFQDSIDIAVVQQVLAYVLGLVAYLQFGSRQGLAVVGAFAVVTSIVVSVWVIVNAVQSGFLYRAAISVNQNLVAYFIGLGLVITLGETINAFTEPRRRAVVPPLLLLNGVMAYALVLLASRGTIIALGLVLVGFVLRVARRNPRQLVPLLAAISMGLLGTLLPGGSGLMERFTEERGSETANGRTPIWGAVITDYSEGVPHQLLLGKGFGSSDVVVSQRFGTLSSAHNAYLEILHEFGLVGLGLFMALHLWALITSWGISGSLGLTMFGLTLFQLGVNTSSSATDGFLYWVVLAFVLAIGTWGNPRANVQKLELQSALPSARSFGRAREPAE